LTQGPLGTPLYILVPRLCLGTVCRAFWLFVEAGSKKAFPGRAWEREEEVSDCRMLPRILMAFSLGSPPSAESVQRT